MGDVELSYVGPSSFFDVFVEMSLPGGGIQNLAVHGTAGPGLSFSDVTLENVSMIGSFFDVFVDLTVSDLGAVDLSEPLVSMTMMGTYVPEPSALVLLSIGGAMLLRRRRAS